MKGKQCAKRTSVALFDDTDVVNADHANKTKCSVKLCAVKPNPTTDTKKIKCKEIDKKNSPKNDSVHNSRNSGSNVNSNFVGAAGNTDKKNKKSVRTTGNDKGTAANAVQKPNLDRTNVPDGSAADKTAKGIKRSARKPVKAYTADAKGQASDKSNSITPTAAGMAGKRKTKEPVKRVDRRACEAEAQVKAVTKLKRKYTRIDHVPGVCTISGKPIPIKDDPFLVRIIINGEPHDVSAWSVKNNIYYPGLDSEFLVHCLSFPQLDKKKR